VETILYNINKYFSEEECSEIIEFCMVNGVPFKYDPTEQWDCRKILDVSFKEKILTRFVDLYKEKKTKYWFNFNDMVINNVNISLTRYYEDRYLNLHKDAISQFTTVIVLNSNFQDGRFVLSNEKGKDISDMRENSTKITLGVGEGISFEGDKTFHGVMPVHNGLRCALNIWMTNESYKNKKTLI
jgi:hypothetical protein